MNFKQKIGVILKILFSFLVLIGVIWAAAAFLKAEGNLILILNLTALINICLIIYTYGKPLAAKIGLVLAFTGIVLLGLFLLLKTVFISYAYYDEWFALFRESGSGGNFPFLFVEYTAFFTVLSLGLYHKCRFLKTLGMISLWCVFLITLIYQSDLWTLALIFVLLINILIFLLDAKQNRQFILKRLVFTGFIFVSTLIGSFLISQVIQPGGIGFANNFLTGFSRNVVLEIFPEFPIMIDAPGQGQSIGGGKMTQRPLLTPNPVLQIKSNLNEIVYLRTNVYDRYSPNGWYLSKALERVRHGNQITVNTDNSSDYPLEIVILTEFYKAIPHTLSTQSLSFEQETQLDIKYDTKDVGFILNQSLLKKTAFILNRKKTGVQDTVQPLSETELKAFLDVPPGIPQEVRSLAAAIGRGSADTAVTAIAIKNYLNQNYKYTLDVNPPPEELDPVSYFILDSKQGYCSHFASAFVLLARLNNIPARYVSGYLQRIPHAPEPVQVTGLSAHAWPEIWLKDAGWVQLEVTPPMLPENYSDPEYYSFFNLDQYDFTRRQLEAMFGELSGTLPGQTQTEFKIDWRLPVILVFIAGFIFLMVLGVRRLVKRTRHRYVGLRRKLQKLLNRPIAKCLKKGVPSPERIGWIKWGDTLILSFPEQTKRIKTLIERIQVILFGPCYPQDTDLEYLKSEFSNLKLR